MKPDKSLRRERKQRKARHGMRITGRSVFTIQNVLVNRAQQTKRPTKRKSRRQAKR